MVLIPRGREFQTDGPAKEKAPSLYPLNLITTRSRSVSVFKKSVSQEYTAQPKSRSRARSMNVPVPEATVSFHLHSFSNAMSTQHSKLPHAPQTFALTKKELRC